MCLLVESSCELLVWYLKYIGESILVVMGGATQKKADMQMFWI